MFLADFFGSQTMKSDDDARRLVVIYLSTSCLGTRANLSDDCQMAQRAATLTSWLMPLYEEPIFSIEYWF
jgi:hypothetical protein